VRKVGGRSSHFIGGKEKKKEEREKICRKEKEVRIQACGLHLSGNRRKGERGGNSWGRSEFFRLA